MKTRRSFRQWWAEVRCHARILQRAMQGLDMVEHYDDCGAEHRRFWST